MTYKIAICDDQQSELNMLSTFVESWSAHTKNQVNIVTFPSAESFLFDYAEHKDYDLLLLDVEMKEMTGIDLAKQIRKENKRVEIVFITSHFEFAGEGYEVDALHYLIKPIKQEKLFSVMDKAVVRISRTNVTLKGQLEAGETERALKYIEELDYEITHVDTLLKTGNLAADVILSAKIAQTKYYVEA